MEDELGHLREALPIIAADPRMGYHSECQRYMFTAASVEAKLRELESLLGEDAGR